MSSHLFLDDRLILIRQAKISPLNTAILYGEGLFETLPVYHGKPLFFREHLDRLEKRLPVLRLEGSPTDIIRKSHPALRGPKYQPLCHPVQLGPRTGPTRQPPAIFTEVPPIPGNDPPLKAPAGRL